MSQTERTSSTRRVLLTIPGASENLSVVRSALTRIAEMEGFGAEEVQKITLAVDEALTNVIRHGYGGSCDKPIRVAIEALDESGGRRGIRIEVRDEARQVDPATIQGRDLNDVRPGGLGVHIIRSVMDRVEYGCPPEGGMRLVLVKYRGDTADASANARRENGP